MGKYMGKTNEGTAVKGKRSSWHFLLDYKWRDRIMLHLQNKHMAK